MNIKKGVLRKMKKNLVSFFHGLKWQHSVSATAIKFGSWEMYVLEKFDSGNSSWRLHSAGVHFSSMMDNDDKVLKKFSNMKTIHEKSLSQNWDV